MLRALGQRHQMAERRFKEAVEAAKVLNMASMRLLCPPSLYSIPAPHEVNTMRQDIASLQDTLEGGSDAGIHQAQGEQPHLKEDGDVPRCGCNLNQKATHDFFFVVGLNDQL